MREAFICAYVRTPIGRYGGALAGVRADDLAAVPLKALLERHAGLDFEAVDDVIYGCANQAGEDNRNVARMAVLLAGLPGSVSGTTINRLCGSGLDALITAARAVKAGEADLMIAGGVESMSRAPFVMPKAESAFSRAAEIHDTTIGWRFINPLMKQQYGVDSMPETGENVAAEFGVSRADQDAFALRSQAKAAAAQKNGRLAQEIVPVTIPRRKGNPVVGGAAAGVPPRIMGIGPVPATRKLCARLGLKPTDFDVVELNEAFASQGLAVLRELGIAEDAPHVNPNGGAIALGHPLGMSGARIAGTAALELKLTGLKRALATMCVGVGQGIAIALETV
ncbi:beta-ketoacyl synthase N-terminal-like domain-containing protein [Microvirga sp. VF16]|uniref:thiolase family protein n=1 Tax=Microvirga sp. VF16 TaxID=2807101 RepID=UPI00193DD7B6|nr:beta-ketoacyl synthase N-terminal-like domain-containing protein [Microvirga sp. VF16]QRM33156.1 3-oxoadipyl-CoA thiolase [Microvirga sp. VF16]